jgi:hypothetical protein
MQNDPPCEGPDDEKVLADVREYGWHVIEIFEQDETPGWAFSIGLYKNFSWVMRIGSIKAMIIRRCNAFGRTRTTDSHGNLSSIRIGL